MSFCVAENQNYLVWANEVAWLELVIIISVEQGDMLFNKKTDLPVHVYLCGLNSCAINTKGHLLLTRIIFNPSIDK